MSIVIVDNKRTRFALGAPKKKEVSEDPNTKRNRTKIDYNFREDRSILEIPDEEPITSLDALFDRKESTTLLKIDIARNAVVKLNVDREKSIKFPNLRAIMAEENEITEVNLVIWSLRSLNLSDNLLAEIPDLNGLPRLEDLRLKRNQISRIAPQVFVPVEKTLLHLDLSGNYITFKNNEDMIETLGEIKRLQCLKELMLLGNPFVKQLPEYKRDLFAGLASIQQIDGVNKTDFKYDKDFDLKSMQIRIDSQSLNVSLNERKVQKRTLIRLNDLLEECLTNPTHCANIIAEIAHESLEISKKSSQEWDEYLSASSKNEDMKEIVELFFEKCMILIENHQDIQSHIIDAIANLSIVNKLDLGKRCFQLLVQLSQPGADKDMLDHVKQAIEMNIMVWIKFKNSKAFKDRDDKRIEVITDVLRGLNTLIHSNDMAALFDDDEYLKCAAGWISECNQKFRACLKPTAGGASTLVEFKKAYSSVIENEDFYDELIDLIRRITAYPPCAIALMKIEGFSIQCCEIFDSLDRIMRRINFIEKDDRGALEKWHKREIMLLEIVDNISKLDPDNAKGFLNTIETKSSFYKTLKNILKKLCEEYATFGYGFTTSESKIEIPILQTLNVRFATYIRTYGTLLNYQPLSEVANALAEKEPGDEILSYLTMGRIDPIIVTASCDFLYSTLTNKEVMESPEAIAICVDKVKQLKKIAHYLGSKRYAEACELAHKYEGESTLTERGEPIPLSKLSSPIIHKLFISIIKLISLICERAAEMEELSLKGAITSEQERLKGLYDEYSEVLNSLQREELLLNCLDIQNDDIKLAVAKCLDNTKIKEIDSDELAHMVRILGGQKNLGIGKTEEILSLIFLILSKAIRKNTKTSHEFIMRYSKVAVENCFEILIRDMARNLSSDPQQEELKVALVLSCIYFLKIASNDPNTWGFFAGEKALQCLRLCLFCEEKFMSHYHIPMDIECTWIGNKIDYLFQCMTGDEAIQPFSLVSFRLISRMADLLTNKPDPDLLVLLKAEDSLKSLKKDVLDGFEKRIKDEIAVWNLPQSTHHKDDGTRIKRAQITEAHFKEQHETFSAHSGVDRLLVFLFGGEDSIQERNLLNEVDEKYLFSTLEEEIRVKMRIFERKYKERSEKQEKKSSEKTEDKKKTTKSFFGFVKEKGRLDKVLVAKMKTDEVTLNISALQMRNLVIEPKRSKGEEKEIQKHKLNESSDEYQYGKQTLIEELIPIPNMTDYERIRALIIAALLRCIYGAIEHAPPGLKTREASLQTIKRRESIRQLTHLCSLTGWQACNIATKYLKVIILALTTSPENSSDIRTLEVYDIVSKAIEDIYSIVSNKIGRQGGLVKLEDREMLYQLALCGSLICLQTPFITLSTLAESPEKTHATTRLRTPQERGTEYLLERLIKQGILESFIETLLRDMAGSMKMKYEEATKYHEQMIRFRLRDAILMMLGEYITRCPSRKYAILEYFAKAQVIRGKKMRQSLVQDILRQVQNITFKAGLQQYCFQKKLVSHPDGFRIHHMMNVDVYDQAVGHVQRMFLCISDKCILLLTPSKSAPCSLCPEEKFCPEGPELFAEIQLKKINSVMDFSLIHKRCAMSFKRREKKFGHIINGETEIKEAVVVITFDRYHSKYYFVDFLKKKGIVITEDRILPRAIQQAYNKTGKSLSSLSLNSNESYLSFEVWLKSNTKPTWTDYWGPKTLFMINGDKLYLLSERLDRWLYIHDPLEEKKTPEEPSNKTTELPSRNTPTYDEIVAAESNYLKVEKELNLRDAERVILEESGLPVLEIEFEK